ncbi:CsbD family protein [Haloechinothrix sp. YIM 98757]|uniref:CsbD family protein n=1 Tax=Haloechinothrix aidingensis TaxID=2752311 RepID=A0A838ADX9_9PSEU|nr:CsbD family protein [Haloechinothrix aidingensis]MBA0127492.1 CsbD family protein [Haloechinothrix aidingensis]
MGILDKIRNKAEQAAGSAKEKAGEVAGDGDLADSGKADRLEGQVREAGNEWKDKAEDVAGQARDKAGGAVSDAKDRLDDRFDDED